MPLTVDVSQPLYGVGLIVLADPPMNFGTPELIARIMEARYDAGANSFDAFDPPRD